MKKFLTQLAKALTSQGRWARRGLGGLFLLAALLCLWPAVRFNWVDRRRMAVASPTELAKPPRGLLGVPIVRQTTEHSCGPAALMSVLDYWQVYQDSETVLHPLLQTTPELGTAPEKIVEAAARFGLSAEAKQDLELSDLAEALDRGEAVIVNFQAWRSQESAATPWKEDWEDGHYAVLIGLDAQFAYLMDPWVGYGYLPLGELVDRWHDYTDREGKRAEYHRLAIFVWGKTPRNAAPILRWVKIE